MTAGTPVRDPGLQPERTALAWLRTGVASGLLAMAAAALGVRRPTVATVAATSLSTLATVVSIGMVVTTVRVLSRGGLGATGSPWPRLAALTTVCLLLAAVGVALAVSRP